MDIILILNLIVLLYIWFDTDAVSEWGGLFKLKFLKYDEYTQARQGPMSQMIGDSYCSWLAQAYDRYFVIRLITCPICFTVWVNIAVSCVFYSIIPLWMWGPNIIMSWIGYHSLRWILKKLNE